MLKQSRQIEYDADTLGLPTPEDEEREMERNLAWFGKFSVEKRLRIGYQHALAALRFMKLRPVE